MQTINRLVIKTDFGWRVEVCTVKIVNSLEDVLFEFGWLENVGGGEWAFNGEFDELEVKFIDLASNLKRVDLTVLTAFVVIYDRKASKRGECNWSLFNFFRELTEVHHCDWGWRDVHSSQKSNLVDWELKEVFKMQHNWSFIRSQRWAGLFVKNRNRSWKYKAIESLF